jgi:hypothetical protein
MLTTGCADLERGPAPPAPDAAADATGGDGGAIPFAMVQPLLDGGCRRCHAPGQEAGDTAFVLTGDVAAEYISVRRLVDPTAPAASRLLAKASGQGHRGGTIYRVSSPEYAALLAWIQSGAGP